MIKAWSYIEEYKDLRKKILESIDRTLKSGQIFFGKELQKFEKQIIKQNNLKYGVAVGSGTDALYIALLGLGIGQGDEVITVSNTAIPTVSAIKSCGARAKFVDIDYNYLIDTNKIEKCIIDLLWNKKSLFRQKRLKNEWFNITVKQAIKILKELGLLSI